MMMQSDDRDAILPPPEVVAKTQLENKVSRLIKFFLLGFTVFFWMLGAVFIAVGGYVLSQSVGYEKLSDFATDPGVIVCVLGFIIFIMSTFGVLGTFRENLCLLKVYRIFLLTMLVFEVFCGLVAFAFWPEVKKYVDKSIATAIKNYHKDAKMREMIDLLQRQLECCGSLNIDDWDSNPYYSCKYVEGYKSCGVPWSCCLKKFYRNRQCGLGLRRNRRVLDLSDTIYTIGCMDRCFEFFKNNMLLVAALAIAFVFPLVVGISMITVFLKQILRQVATYGTVKSLMDMEDLK